MVTKVATKTTPKPAVKTVAKAPAKSRVAKANLPKVAIVVPMYQEEDNAALLVSRVQKALTGSSYNWCLFVVDDGSRDNTLSVLRKLEDAMPEYRLQVIGLQRNYGQATALQAGFDMALERGAELIVTLDGDLQNDPDDIVKMLNVLETTDADMVTGWRKNRQDPTLLRVIPSKIANKILVKVTGVDIHDNGCALKAYKRPILQNIHLYGEGHRFITALAAQAGAKIVEVPVNHSARQFGTSKYGIDRTVRVALDMIQLYFFRKFLQRPMHAFGYVGLCMMIPGVLAGLYLTILKLLGHSIGGRPLLMLSVLLIVVGVQLLATGIIAELLMRIYHEPQGRRQYLTKIKR